MELEIEDLLQDLHLKMAENDEKDLLKQYILFKESILVTVKKISTRIRTLGFSITDEAMYIRYNKEWMGPLYGKYVYYDKCYRLEFYKRYLPAADLQAFIERQLRSICRFFNTHYEFCQYWDAGGTERDWFLFTPNNSFPSPVDNEKLGLSSYINPCTLLAACYLAYKEYGTQLQKELRSASTPTPQEHKKALFRGSKTDLVELATVLHASGDILVNGQAATQEYIIEMLETIFGVDLENYRVVKTAIHRRKKDRFPYTKRLLSGGEQYFNALDDEKRPHKALRSNS
jgi:RteC protein